MKFQKYNSKPVHPAPPFLHITANWDVSKGAQSFDQLLILFESKKIALNIEQIKEKYHVQYTHLNQFTAERARNIYHNIYIKKEVPRGKRNWHQNQLWLFFWVIFSLEAYLAIPIAKFKSEDWKTIVQIFIGKTLEDIQFEWLLIHKCSDHLTLWTKTDDQLLLKLMGDQRYNGKWTEIAKYIFIESSGRNFKNSKQVRERWHNHLNPSFKKGVWSLQQDLALIETVIKCGRKWASISRLLENRTEHNVKNRYQSLLKKYQALLSKKNKTPPSKELKISDPISLNLQLCEYIKKQIEEASGDLKIEENQIKEQPQQEQPLPVIQNIEQPIVSKCINSKWSYFDSNPTNMINYQFCPSPFTQYSGSPAMLSSFIMVPFTLFSKGQDALFVSPESHE